MLAKRYQEHQDPEAAAQLVTSHLRLVAKIAMGYRGYGLPVSELISEGNIGLMQGVKKFEPDRGFRLATYAMWWIKASIQEFILRSWSLVKMGTTAAQKKLFFNLRRMKNNLEAFEDGDLRPEDVTKIATDLGVSEDDVVSMNRRMAMGGDTSLNVRCARMAKASGRTAGGRQSVAGRARRRRRREGHSPQPAAGGDGQPQRSRKIHSHRTPPRRRAQDAGRALPSLWRQPRARAPDRGSRVREIAEGDDADRGRALSRPGVTPPLSADKTDTPEKTRRPRGNAG
jgi:RNA polymerase sigma factor (sigma-70 family)